MASAGGTSLSELLPARKLSGSVVLRQNHNANRRAKQMAGHPKRRGTPRSCRAEYLQRPWDGLEVVRLA